MSGPEAAAVTRHRDVVRALSRPDGPLSVTSSNATVNNPAWFRSGARPRGARAELHDALVAARRAVFHDARADRRAVVLAGPPGAGKSTVRRKVLGEPAADWLVVDADEFEHALLRAAIEDGSYRAFLVPDAVRDLEAAGERFAPLELASLVHVESSLLARRLTADAVDADLNVLVDTVLSDEATARALGARLERAGYRVHVVDVETTHEICTARVEQRWRDVTREPLEDGSSAGLGGRWVPSEYTRGLFPAELGGASVCEGVARVLAEECEAVHRLDVYRVDDVAAAPRLHLTLRRPGAGAPLESDLSAAGAAPIE